jgi:flagellar hook-associated protein 2
VGGSSRLAVETMAGIQSSTGLITGIPIQDTVNQLMAVASQPKTILTNRNKSLQSEKLAVTQLSSLLVALQFEAKQFGSTNLFESTNVTSSDTATLAASAATGKTPPVGKYLFTPVQTASSQQLLSQGFGAGETVGAGTITFGSGGFVDLGIALAELNEGDGVPRGKIRITDRNGETATIDLTHARTVDDVLTAINEDSTISITAVAVGDKFKLIDNSGGMGNIKVQEVAGGTTAAALGLAGIDEASDTATGTDVFSLHEATKLSLLNDATGVQLKSGNDLTVTLADESTVEIDLGDAKTLGDVIEAINAASPTKLSATIGTDGNRIELTDLTTGSGTFAVADVGGGTAARDLGLLTEATGDTITGSRLVSGLRDTLVSSLNGGRGLGELGIVDVTNRNNVVSNVDLSGAETLGEIIAEFNTQGTGFTAAINQARNGIVLTDTTGFTANNFAIDDGDANETATALGIVKSVAGNKVDSGSLDRRQISEATPLSSLNGGAGITVSDILITDSDGHVGGVDLKQSGNDAKTIGDVIERINALSDVGVEARMNDRGDGIVLIDTAGGPNKLKVREVGSGTTARDLHILGDSTEIQVDGQTKQGIDGTSAATVTIDADDKLADVVQKINDLGRGVSASIVNDGIVQRLSISVDKTGTANALVIDSSNTAFSFDEVSSARDALLLYGSNSSSGVLIASSTNEFSNVVDGINLSVNDASSKTVTVNVTSTSSGLVSNAKEFVAAYNSLRTNLDTVTSFDAENLTTGILFGTTAALRVDSDLTHVITSRFFGFSSFQSLESVGISLDDKGKMTLDESKLKAAYAKDPDSLKKMFTDKDRGVAKKLSDVIEQLAGKNNSVLTSRSTALSNIIEANEKRITTMDEILTKQRDRLLTEFYRIESTVAKLQDSLAALSSFQVVPPLTSTKR